jgi:hypothetical protein
MKFFKNNPRISSLLIGFALGLVVVIANDRWANATIMEYKEIVAKRESKYEELIAKNKITISSLSKSNENLKRKTATKTVTLPDGTITEESTTSTDSSKQTETDMRQSIESEYNKKLYEIKSEYMERESKITNRKLRIGVGYSTKLVPYIIGSYNILGPLSMGGSINKTGTLTLDIGISL